MTELEKINAEIKIHNRSIKKASKRLEELFILKNKEEEILNGQLEIQL